MNEKVIKNPILSGVYPDPSICRVGDDFYMVCSSFELYPGLPVFHSKDLAHWQQICYAMTMENGFHVEANILSGGVMAPTIRYHDGTFYIINCNFNDQGNYIITANDPAGPWSAPHWLDDVPGIDASIFFDEDGTCYVMGTGNVVRRADGTMERGIWAAEYDIHNFKRKGEAVPIWDSALRGAASPEAPHIYKVDGWYYLVIAEGGTEHYHCVTVARSREVLGWYEGNPANPVITHRQFGFHCPIANVGHADLVDTPSGHWYAVLLASRTVEGYYKNLGRETFICPVIWEREWPVFSPESGKVDWTYPADETLPWCSSQAVAARDDFDQEVLDLKWNFWGTPYQGFWHIKDSRLYLKCLPKGMAEELLPLSMEREKIRDDCISVLFRRQEHTCFDVQCEMTFAPEGKEAAGILIMQAENHHYRVEMFSDDRGKKWIRLVLTTADFQVPPHIPGFESKTKEQELACVPWNKTDVFFTLKVRGQDYSFYYGEDPTHETPLMKHGDGRLINPEIVSGMMGTMIGVFATGNRTESKNQASFDWFSYLGWDKETQENENRNNQAL